MELMIALVLFIGLIASWLVLPGSSTSVVSVDAEPEATGLGRTTVGQSA
jgi:hypothetical protein